MPLFDSLRKAMRLGRPRHAPPRDTKANPLFLLGGPQSTRRAVIKPTPHNLRAFGRTPYARRAINAIKNPIAMLEWEIAPVRGVEMNSELERQVEIVHACLERPNNDDSFRSLLEQVVEDALHGAGAIELQLGGDTIRPLWLYPVDGLSIRLYPGWTGEQTEARYAQHIRGHDIPLRNDELIYIRPNPSTATPFGLGPLEVAFMSISRQLGVGEFAGNVASNARPSILINVGKGADEGAMSSFRAYWRNEVEGQGTTPIAGMDGGKVERLYPEGDDGLYLLYQEFLLREIATAFDISPQNLGVERDVKVGNGRTAEDRDWDQAIVPFADLMSAYLTREAIQGKLGFSQLQLRFPALDAEDEGPLSENFARDYLNNAETPNNYRKRKGLPPLDSEFADMLKVDCDIASNAARSAGQVLDPKLNPAPPAPQKG